MQRVRNRPFPGNELGLAGTCAQVKVLHFGLYRQLKDVGFALRNGRDRSLRPLGFGGTGRGSCLSPLLFDGAGGGGRDFGPVQNADFGR